MKKRLFSLAALLIALSVSLNSYAQTEQKTLMLGNYETPDGDHAWDGFNLQNAPVIFAYVHSGTQVMYTAEQLAEMKDKKISSISFKCFPENCYVETYSSTMKMYINEVEDDKFSYDPVSELYSWVEFDENNPIVEMDFTMSPFDAYNESTDIEVNFNLDNPYLYTGKNLVITIVNDSPESIDSDGAIRFYWIDSKKEDPWKSLVFASDKFTFFENQAKDNVLKPLDNEDKWKNAPAVRFDYIDTTSTGVCDITAADNNKVTTAEGNIVITLSDNADVQITSVTGESIKCGKLSEGTHSYAMPEGVYIVRINDNTYKVCVSR